MHSDLLNLIPRHRLRGWWAADDIIGVSTGGIVSDWPDRSGHGHALSCEASRPTFVASGQNGRPAINFSGSNDPLTHNMAIGNVKHVFVVAAYSDLTFGAQPPGLLSGYSDAMSDVLVGVPSGTTFYDFSYPNYQYRMREVAYAANAQAAPMSSNVAVMEVTLQSGWFFNGITVGRQYGFSDRRWKGRVYEIILLDSILADTYRRDIYEYLAIKYRLWSRTAAGMSIFPFQPNWSRPLGVDKTILASRSVAGTTKSREKQGAKRTFEPRFADRYPEEYETAVAFWNQHYPTTNFVYRDIASIPSRDIVCQFNGGIPAAADSYRAVDYSFQASEI